ncbi:histidine kinase [Streptomyces griseofuscus]|uniref:histidine kinase n=1 Tax=Streptomyces griseofuscus TaxID=146922 RepID=UPI0033DF4B1E
MVVQAAAADDVFESNPQQARAALRRTEEAGRQALAELRGFLRTVRADGGADEAALQPTLDDVPRLTETMNQAGLAVTLLRVRHARASSAQVLLDIDETQVRVRITDDGRGGAPGQGGGHGLVGMRERATLLGGTLYSGPRWDAAGFEVDARLPIREGS